MVTSENVLILRKCTLRCSAGKGHKVRMSPSLAQKAHTQQVSKLYSEWGGMLVGEAGQRVTGFVLTTFL